MSLVHFLAMAQPGEGSGGGGAAMMNFGFIIVMFAIIYFLMIRPQQKRHKKHQEMLKSLKKGDRIVTSGGLIAKVLNVKDDRLVATIAEGVKVEIARNSVATVIEKGEA
ncbi:MAG: preprotein translocase subunit YajC [bacterium]